MIYSSGRMVVSSKEEQTVIRQSRSLLEDQEKEEWRRVNGRLKRLPNSSTSTVGEKVLV